MIHLRVARAKGFQLNGCTYTCPALEVRSGEPITVDDLDVTGGLEVLVIFIDGTHAAAERPGVVAVANPQLKGICERRMRRRIDELNALKSLHLDKGATP